MNAIIEKFRTPQRVREFVALVREMTAAYESFKIEEDYLNSIVRFFQMTTAFYDSAYAMPFQQSDFSGTSQGYFQQIMGHLQRVARGDINRAKHGEAITADNVFLGNYYGIWTMPVSIFLQEKFKTELSGVHNKDGNEMTVRQVINDQARTIIVNGLAMRIIFIIFLKEYEYLNN